MTISPFAAFNPFWSKWVSGRGHSVRTSRMSLGSSLLNPIVDVRSTRTISCCRPAVRSRTVASVSSVALAVCWAGRSQEMVSGDIIDRAYLPRSAMQKIPDDSSDNRRDNRHAYDNEKRREWPRSRAGRCRRIVRHKRYSEDDEN